LPLPPGRTPAADFLTAVFPLPPGAVLVDFCPKAAVTAGIAASTNAISTGWV
jgi:hypothetical protein